MLGFGFGSWLSRLPAVRDHLDATTLQMSIYGFCLAVGSVAGLLLAGRVISRLGPRRTLQLGIAAQAVCMPAAVLVLWTGQVPLGLALLFGYGFAFSNCDVAMNISGASAERALGRPRLPLLHAGFSLGSVSAMGVGAAAEALGIAVPFHLIGVFLLILGVSLTVLRWVPAGDRAAIAPAGAAGVPATKTGPIPVVRAEHASAARAAPKPARARNPWTDPRILLVGFTAMSMALAEGTAADWLPLALVDGRGVSNELGALILGVFFVSMTVTRVVGSPILHRFGRVPVLRGGAILCAIGVVVVILVPATWAIVLGAICWGVGCALGFPVGISAAADDPATAVRDVAAVSAIAYTAMLLGPMAFGFLGEHIGLLTAFWLLAAIVLLGGLASVAARERSAVELVDSDSAGGPGAPGAHGGQEAAGGRNAPGRPEESEDVH
ncbi:MFS transporter [Leucobacter triazinivorans]|uniref:MFS transporter n=2 Tax=Leucobacter triazinivorans TaxID=1784719 RepID=A0A4P6KIC8_9MICO|nr:MFS transporter [Leucobacter triazinivorans]